MIRLTATFVLLLAPVLMAGCDRSTSAERVALADDAEAPLPGPETAGDRSVTGMPDEPGPNPAPVASMDPALAPATAPPGDADTSLPPPGTPPAATPAVPGAAATTATEPAMPTGPTAADAVAVVRDYYAAIAAGRFEQAHGLWANDGRASGQSPQQFAGGFADTASVSVDVLEPGRMEPAAGSRYIEVPVAVTAVHRDGSRHRYVGAYTLRRSVVDGASEEQRAWRLQSADIREVQL